MKKLELYILILGVILCATVRSVATLDQSLTNRFIVWSLITVILVILILVRAKRTDFSIFKRAIFCFFLGYTAMAFFSYNSEINQGEWVYETLKILLMLIYFGIACLILKDMKDIAKPLTILTVCLGVYGLWSLNKVYINGGVTAGIGTMGNKNMWAQAMLLLMPFCISVLKNKGWRLIGITGIVLALADIFISDSRGVILALIISVILTAMVFDRRIFFTCIILGLLCVCVVNRCKDTVYVNKMLNTESSKDRLATWKQTLRMTNDEFMVGAGQWKIHVAKYAAGFKQKLSFLAVFYNRPHNDFLWVLAELSIFGLICYLFIFLLGLWYAIHGENKLVFAGLVAYIVIAFVAYPKERAFASMMLCIYLALAIKSCHPVSKEPHKFSLSEILRHGQTHYLFERPKLNLSMPVICASSAIVLSVLGMCFYDFCVRYQTDIKSKKVHFAKKDGANEIIIKELSYIPKLSTVDTHGIPYHYYRGLAYTTLGDKKKGIMDYSIAYTQNPWHFWNLLCLGQAFFEINQPIKAAEFYEAALDIRPNHQVVKEDLEKIKSTMR